MPGRRVRRDVVWTSGAFLLDAEVVLWRVGLGPGVRQSPALTRPWGRRRLEGWVAREPTAAERLRTAVDRPADVSWWDRSGELTRSSLSEGTKRTVQISVARCEVSDLGPLDLVSGVPVQRPVHVDEAPFLVSSQSLGTSDLGTVHIVVIVAGERGLPWPDEDSYGMVGRQWATGGTAGNESYFIGVFEPTGNAN